MARLAEAGIHTLMMDVTDEVSVSAGLETIIAESRRIDVLVNNAGYGSYGALEDVPLSEARYQFEVNVFGLARLTQLVLPHMRAQRGGRIVNVSSIGGKMYEPLGGWYHASKFAVDGLSDSLRVELKPFGIHVLIIEPGAIRTEWSGISSDNLLKVSGTTAYAKQAKSRGAFEAVFANAIAELVNALPLDAGDLPGYAVALFDHDLRQPELSRLARWHGLERPAGQVTLPEAVIATGSRVEAIEAAQREGTVNDAIPAKQLLDLVCSLAATWSGGSPLPVGATDPPYVIASYRAAFHEAVRRLTSPWPVPKTIGSEQ